MNRLELVKMFTGGDNLVQGLINGQQGHKLIITQSKFDLCFIYTDS